MIDNNYESCPNKSCGANFDGYCRQPVLKCDLRLRGIIIHKSFTEYWTNEMNKKRSKKK